MTESYPSDGRVGSDLIRVLAPNPSPMTAEGTNTFVLGRSDVAIIDPGPALDAHLDAVERAVAGRRVIAILITHSHLDHSPAAKPLSRRLQAPVLGFGPSTAGRTPEMEALTGLGGGEGVDHDFMPDRLLSSGDLVSGDGWSLRAHWTPGHMANHLSFEWAEAATVFTGDTVMGWASTMISPPDGDLGQFMDALDSLERLEAKVFHPGHGGPVHAPAARCRALRDHRQARTAAILMALDQTHTIPGIVAQIYADTPPALLGAAGRNVLAHLLHLIQQGLVTASPVAGPDACYSRA